MSTKPKATSRWGSLLSGAVAGLESRLDNILADEGTVAAKNAQVATASGQIYGTKDHVNEALPARLSSEDATQRYSLDVSSRPSSSRTSTEILVVRNSQEPTLPNSEAQAVLIPSLNASTPETSLSDHASAKAELGTIVQPTHDDGVNASPRSSLDLLKASSELHEEGRVAIGEKIVAADNTHSVQELRSQLALLQEDFEKAELQRQEESHANLERIDALQAKLNYLAKEALASARQAAAEAEDDSFEKKLAAKDEQIALLLEEGQKLSKSEVTHATTIKRLRAKLMEDGRGLADMKRKLTRAETYIGDMSVKMTRAESSQRDLQTKVFKLPRLEKEIIELKNDRETRDSTIDILKRQLTEANRRAEEELRLGTAKALEEERRVSESLREDVANAKIEHRLIEDRSRIELNTNQEELQREQERSKTLELGLRNEILILEGRLEVLRVRTEEASSGVTSESQAKLLRQIETLQSQYTFANENWQAVEGSLQARVVVLEKEKDEATKLEADSRKKIREISSISRRLQDQIEEYTRKCKILEHDLLERREELQRTQSHTSAIESQLTETKASFEREQQSWSSAITTRIEEERQKWRLETIPEPSPPIRNDSPSYVGGKKTVNHDYPGLGSRRQFSRHISSDLTNFHLDQRSPSRRTVTNPGRGVDLLSPNGHDSERSGSFFNSHAPETPSIHTMDQDEAENGSSPHRTVNDMLSVTTAAAGPSVQVVERLSAAVRRLESEKAASKDELTMLSKQRDEARQEVVSLMQEVEEKHAVDVRVKQLEQEISKVHERYQTTLEMLGEKSERVGELEADILDLKKIYRELIETTVK